jgi:hypothetical protein
MCLILLLLLVVKMIARFSSENEDLVVKTIARNSVAG